MWLVSEGTGAGIKTPEVQIRAFCTLPGDLRMLIAGPHPVVSPAFELVCMRRGSGSARYGREGIVGLRRLWRSRARPAADAGTLSGISSEEGDETCRGGYLITEVPDSPVMVLTVPLPKNDRVGTGAWRHLPVSVPPEMLQAGQFYLIGGPGQESCEVVRVEAEAVPGQPRCIRRHLFRTLGPVSHPAGTWVRRVTVERVFDWARWEAARRACDTGSRQDHPDRLA